ncbi:MAG: hypothetical protein DRO93_11435, partial [Candidatus Thorarchaeota archaeon]
PQDSSSGYRSSGCIYTSFRKTAELWWGPFQGGHGVVYASIDGQSDGYPIAECDNASRVIKYVAILGYRYSSVNLVGMRIHDINVVADLNRHDPTAPDPDAPQESDGTVGGLTTTRIHQTMNYYAEEAANRYFMGNLTGPWPTYHVYLLLDGLVLLHITIDILNTVQIVEICLLEWFMGLLGISYDDMGFWLGLIEKVFEKYVLLAAMGYSLLSMSGAMMIFDYTKALWAFGIGLAAWFLAAGIAYTVSNSYAERSDLVAAAFVWVAVLMTTLGLFLGGLKNPVWLANRVRPVAKQVFSFVARIGMKVPWGGSRLAFGWTTLIFTALTVGLSVFWIVLCSQT